MAQAPPTHQVWSVCNPARLKKSKKLVQRTPIITTCQNITQKNLSWTKLHPPTKFEPCAPYRFWEKARANPQTHPYKQRIGYYYIDDDNNNNPGG